MKFSAFLEQWKQNTRLRVGVWVIFGILLIYALLTLRDFRGTVERDYEALADRVRRLETLAQEEGWADRVRKAESVRVQVEGRLWQADSRGMAQAKIQTWLDDMAKLTPEDLRTKVEDAREMEGHEGLWVVDARIEARFNAARFLALLRNMESHPQLVTVEQLIIQTRGRKPHFVMVFKAYFRATARS
jgi:hypothetical protein